MMTRSRFLQDAFEVEGHGLAEPSPLGGSLARTVPDGTTVVVDPGLVEV